MFVREFSVNIMGGVMDRLDLLGEKYTVDDVRNGDEYVSFDFEEQSGLIEAIMVESADYVMSFTGKEEKREAFIKCCEQLRLISKEEIEEFAVMCGYMTLQKV